jgi:hypothetical protein
MDQHEGGAGSEDLIGGAAAPGRAVATSRRLTGRDLLTFRIPKPQDPGFFQRACVPLMVRHLSDPHAQEYGVSGHDQSGIDIISRRDGDLTRRVGVQCKHVKRLTKSHIRDDTTAALKIEPPLSEIILSYGDAISIAESHTPASCVLREGACRASSA